LLDSLGGATQHVSVKDIARLPPQRTAPVQVYVGRAPGYVGPVARARAPGAPVGQQPDLAAYASEKPEPIDSEASPISKPAPDATTMRRGSKSKAATTGAKTPAAGNPTPAKAAAASKPAIAKTAASKPAATKSVAPKPATAARPAPKALAAAKQGKT
jgi:D-alanyl-D-alanine carboxypeptidase